MGIDVTYWHYSQFKIDELLFVVREDRSRYDLVAKKQCKKCKAWLHSYPVNSLLDLGAVLANDNGWASHSCPPKLEPRKTSPVTREQRVYRLLQELAEVMFGNQIDPSHIDNWPPQ